MVPTRPPVGSVQISAAGSDPAHDAGVSPHWQVLSGHDWKRRQRPADTREEPTRMKVWIDQDLCTGDGLCEEIAPEVFAMLDDGLAYVKEGDKIFSDPGGPEGLAVIPDGLLEATIESAEECPGECIYIEVE